MCTYRAYQAYLLLGRKQQVRAGGAARIGEERTSGGAGAMASHRIASWGHSPAAGRARRHVVKEKHQAETMSDEKGGEHTETALDWLQRAPLLSPCICGEGRLTLEHVCTRSSPDVGPLAVCPARPPVCLSRPQCPRPRVCCWKGQRRPGLRIGLLPASD